MPCSRVFPHFSTLINKENIAENTLIKERIDQTTKKPTNHLKTKGGVE